jgi:hypothetical protein
VNTWVARALARERRTHWALVVGVAVVAFALRAVLVTSRPPPLFPGADNAWYDLVAQSFADGHLGRLPAVGGGRVFSTRFPPGYPVVLALGRGPLFFLDFRDAHLWTGVILGTVGAALVAALGWRLASRAGERCQVLLAASAGLLFAVNPIVVGAAPSLMAETLVLPVVAGTLLLTDRLLTGDGGWPDAVGLGALLAVGALTRGEGVLLLGAVVVGGWIAARARGRAARPWLVALGIGVAAVVAWSAVISVASHRVVALSTNSGSLLLGANCPLLDNANSIGYWSVGCLEVRGGPGLSPETARRSAAQLEFLEDHFALPPQIGAPGEAEISTAQFNEATNRLTERPLPTLAAIPVRVLRGLGLYWSQHQSAQEYYEGRDHGWEVVGRWFNAVVVLPFAFVAVLGVAWRRSRLGARVRALVDIRRLVPSFVLIAAWVLVLVATYGSARFRAVVEPSLALLAGIGITVVLTMVTDVRAARSTVRDR